MAFSSVLNENRFIVKANWFETALNDVNAGPQVNVGNEAYGRINSYRDAELNLERTFDNQLVTVQGDPGSFPIQDYQSFYDTMLSIVPDSFKAITNPRFVDDELNDGIWDTLEWDRIPNLRSTQDRVAEGFELELIANPTPGWRILANISQQETVQSNTASVMAAVVEEFTAGMQSARIGELRRDPTGTVQTRPIDEIWLSESVAEVRGAAALDNTVSNEQRAWRYTFVFHLPLYGRRLSWLLRRWRHPLGRRSCHGLRIYGRARNRRADSRRKPTVFRRWIVQWRPLVGLRETTDR